MKRFVDCGRGENDERITTILSRMSRSLSLRRIIIITPTKHIVVVFIEKNAAGLQ
jgi:hypothetical protein